MKKKPLLLCAMLFFMQISIAQKTKFDEIKPQCPDMPMSKKVRLSVSTFQVATVNNPGQLGDELAQMLTDALQNVNCFNVLLSTKDIQQIQGEIGFGQSGNTAEGSSPETGKMKGAQVIVMGKVTSYSMGEKTGGGGGVQITKGDIAKVGFIITLINPETREIIASQPVEVEGKAGGIKGVKVLGFNMGGSKDTRAVQEIVHQGIIKAAEFIASQKEKMELPEANSGVAAKKVFNGSNCAVLNSTHIPKVMIIVPEYHITQRFPDPAAETEMNRKFLEAGFQVVDPAMFATINNSIEFKDATNDPAKAISLGKEFGADIVIYGEAVSQRPGTVNAHDAGTQNGQASCRARVEVRAVRTDNATMIATNGMEAGALDNAEFVAAKAALRKAGGLTADYLLGQICAKNLSFKEQAGFNGSNRVVVKPSTEIIILNADYSQLKGLADLLAPKGKVLVKNLSDGQGYIKFEHSGDTQNIADFIETKASTKYSIKNIAEGKITVLVK